MTFAAVGSFLQSVAATVSLTNQGIGDLILLEVETPSASIFATAVSGGGATWTQMGTTFSGSVNARSAAVFAGTVTATGAQTATVTFNGSPAIIRIVGKEFTSSAGSWALDAQGHLDSGGGTNTWASLTPAGAGELYFGYAVDSGSATAGSTTGYTYNIDSVGNGCAFNPACASSAQAPVWGDSGQVFGVMVLVKETGGGGTPHNDTAALAMAAPTRANTRVHGHNPAGALALAAPTRAVLVGYGKTPRLTVIPAAVNTRVHANTRGAALTVRPSGVAVPSGGHHSGGGTVPWPRHHRPGGGRS